MPNLKSMPARLSIIRVPVRVRRAGPGVARRGMVHGKDLRGRVGAAGPGLLLPPSPRPGAALGWDKLERPGHFPSRGQVASERRASG